MKNSTLRFYFDGIGMQEIPEIDGEEMYHELPVYQSDLLPIRKEIDWSNVGAHIGITLMQFGVAILLAPVLVNIFGTILSSLQFTPLIPVVPLTKMLSSTPICL